MAPEQDVAIGSVGKLKLEFSGGKAQVSADVALPGGFTATLAVADDAGALVDQLFAAIEKGSPAGAVPIEETVKSLIKAAVLAIK